MLAMVRRRIGLELKARQDNTQKQPAPMFAADEVGVLALPADARGLRERLLHHRGGVDEDLELAAAVFDEPSRQSFQRLLEGLVIVAALSIDGHAPELGPGRECHRVGRRGITHRERDRGLCLGPERERRYALVGPRLHPSHGSVVTGLEPAHDVEPGGVGRVRAREAAGCEAQLRRLRPYCFLKPLALMHASVPTSVPAIFVGISVLQQVSNSTASDALAVEAIDLVKDFGDTRAVDGVSLAVPTGSIYGLLGPNGAGKTTILRILLGIIDPSSGTRRVLGHERPLEAAAEIGYLPEERGLYPAMTARDGIAFMGALRGLPLAEGRRRADVLLAEHGLGDWGRKSIRSLSKGMAQIVQLLGTIIHKPRLIVLDEPFAGLDAINQA